MPIDNSGDNYGLVDPYTGQSFDSPSSPGVVGSTGGAGSNDPSSPWTGLVSGVSTLGNTAGNILKGLNGQPAKKKSTLPSWLPIAAIAGVALLVIVLLMGRK